DARSRSLFAVAGEHGLRAAADADVVQLRRPAEARCAARAGTGEPGGGAGGVGPRIPEARRRDRNSGVATQGDNTRGRAAVLMGFIRLGVAAAADRVHERGGAAALAGCFAAA